MLLPPLTICFEFNFAQNMQIRKIKFQFSFRRYSSFYNIKYINKHNRIETKMILFLTFFMVFYFFFTFIFNLVACCFHIICYCVYIVYRYNILIILHTRNIFKKQLTKPNKTLRNINLFWKIKYIYHDHKPKEQNINE